MNARTRLVVLILVVALPFRTVLARSVEDRREVQGRALFAKGDYQAALDVYANLFAEKGDPIYLRNIGRCYQNLEEPEKAIKAFREYLRRGHVKSGERTEVEGFIKDMEDLEQRKAATAPPPVEPARPPAGQADAAPARPAAPAAVTEAPPPHADSGPNAPGAVLTAQAPAEEEVDTRSRAGGGSGPVWPSWWPVGRRRPSC